MIPSIKEIVPSRPKIINNAVTMITNGISYFTVDLATCNVTITAASPKIMRIFKILLPTIFPIVISALPFRAAFSVGLRENSRIKQKLNESPADDMTIFLASITDRLGLILTALTGVEKPPSIVEHILGTEATKNGHVLSFESPEEFIKQRYGGSK